MKHAHCFPVQPENWIFILNEKGIKAISIAFFPIEWESNFE